MTEPKKHLADWLRDAHAMEKQAETMMKSVASRLEHYPDLRVRFERYAEQSQKQAARLENCIERNGGGTSAVKDIAGKLTASIQGLSGLFVEDEVVKGHLAVDVFHHFQVASYRILVAAANEVGDTETRNVCEEILRDEEEAAAWLGSQLSDTTHEYLQRDLAELEAKH